MVLKSTLYPSNKGNFLKANATSTGLSGHATASFRGFIEDRRSRSHPSLPQAQWLISSVVEEGFMPQLSD